MKVNHGLFTREIPDKLVPYSDLAADLRWTWSHSGDAVWKSMDPVIWEQTENPYAVIQNMSQERLDELAKDRDFIKRLKYLSVSHKDYCCQPTWFSETHESTDLKMVAYFSMEFGLGKSLPLYAGGLGILAGDYLKAASDMGVPVVAIGLLYQEGYFRQMLDADGWQQEVYPYNDSTSLPIRPVQAKSGAWLHVTLDFPGRPVRLRLWQAQVGRVSLYLLDSNDPLNSPGDRGITSKLYGGGQELRLVQEIALGIGGWRALEALGLDIDICHLNEGHAAFVTLERARRFMQQNKVDCWEALWATRAGNVFTTHTPVAAGFDTYQSELLMKYGKVYADRIGVEPEDLLALGRKDPDNKNEPFNMAFLATRTCALTNGVSQLHGEVSRHIFKDLYPHWPEEEVPVSHITNGIHVPSWDSPWADELWTKACGKERWLGTADALSSLINDLSDEALWTFRGQERADLVMYARRQLALQLGQNGAREELILQARDVLDPNVLTIGFARRFATYKRPNLLLEDQQRFLRLLSNRDLPVQFIVAGKAHPQDQQGKQFVQEWAHFVAREDVRHHIVFLQDYDIAMAQEMVQGVDVWINTPLRPWEACGTSGMKVLVNGGLNISELDGWWAEAYADDVGWALGDGKEHREAGWNTFEAEQLYRLLEDEIVPMFYQRDMSGIPREWVKRIRTSMSRLAPRYSTNRMVQDYVESMYLPSAAAYQRRCEQQGHLAHELCQWERDLRHHWQEIHWGNLQVNAVKEGWLFAVQVYLGEISADYVQVQLYADASDRGETNLQVMNQGVEIAGASNAYNYRCSIHTSRPSSDFTPRIIAHHPEARVPAENILIKWWQ